MFKVRERINWFEQHLASDTWMYLHDDPEGHVTAEDAALIKQLAGPYGLTILRAIKAKRG